MLKTFTLKNGLRVAVYSIPEMKSVFLSLSVKSGAIFETEKNNGIAHFVEHMLLEGIPSLPNAEVFSDFIEGLAGSYNAFTSRQTIRFTVNGPAPHLKDLLMIAGEVLFKPLFPKDGLEKERGAILEELRQIEDSPGFKNSQFFAGARYKKNHPMRLPLGGSAEIVQKLTREDLMSFWAKYFYPGNTYLVVVGNFNMSSIEEIVEEYFLPGVPKTTFPGFPKHTNQDFSSGGVFLRRDPALQACYVNFTFPSISDEYSLKEHLPQLIARTILGGLGRSRLFRLLRQRRGLVYEVNFVTGSFQYFGFGDVYCQTSLEKLDEVVGLITKELGAIKTGGPTKEEVELAKDYRINRALMSFDHPSSIASWIEGDLLWEDKVYLPEEYTQLISEVSLKQVKEFMEKYWEFDKLSLVIQGPVQNTKKNKEKFQGLIKELR